MASRVAHSSPQQFAGVTSVTFAFAAGSGAVKTVVDVAFLGFPSNPASVFKVLYDGVDITASKTSRIDRSAGSYVESIQSFYLDSPPTGSVNIEVQFDVASYGTCGATSYSGVDTGRGAVTSNTGSSGTATVTQASSTSGSIIHAACVCAYTGDLTAVETDNWTGAAGGTWKGGSEFATSSGSSKAMTWTISSSVDWAALVFELTAPAPSGGPAPHFVRRSRNLSGGMITMG